MEDSEPDAMDAGMAERLQELLQLLGARAIPALDPTHFYDVLAQVGGHSFDLGNPQIRFVALQEPESETGHEAWEETLGIRLGIRVIDQVGAVGGGLGEGSSRRMRMRWRWMKAEEDSVPSRPSASRWSGSRRGARCSTLPSLPFLPSTDFSLPSRARPDARGRHRAVCVGAGTIAQTTQPTWQGLELLYDAAGPLGSTSTPAPPPRTDARPGAVVLVSVAVDEQRLRGPRGCRRGRGLRGRGIGDVVQE